MNFKYLLKRALSPKQRDNLKKIPGYFLLKKVLYDQSSSKYPSKIISPGESNLVITKSINDNTGMLISRLGSTEIPIISAYNKKEKYNPLHKKVMITNGGFFPIYNNHKDKLSLDRFSELFEESIEQIDLLGVSMIPGESEIISRLCPSASLTKLSSLEPFFFDEPWSYHLKGKRVLVIHPFVDSIKKQYKDKENIFSEKILPSFDLMTIAAVQSLGGNSEFSSWFDALDSMKSEIDKYSFDVAIIGAGLYGLPLAKYIKDKGKVAIHLGGATQIMFGVKGKRWENNPKFHNVINENWISPSEEETPKSSKNVEDACYW